MLYNRALILLFLFNCMVGYAKNNDHKTIEILNADELVKDKSLPKVSKLIGHVKVKHDDFLITCDRAILHPKKCFLQAEGRVKANQADSIFLNGNYLEYDCNTKIVITKYDVLLKTPNNQLETDTLKLFRFKDLAVFRGGGKLTSDDGLIITCEKGSNDMKTKIYSFEDDVVMKQDSTVIYTDFATYNPIDSTVTTYTRTTVIQNEKDTLIFDHGSFNNIESLGHGVGNVEGFHNNSKLVTDSTTFDKRSGTITLFKNSIVIDSTGQNRLEGNFIKLFEDKDSIFATNDPYYLYKEDSTTIEFTADTLISKKIDSSGIVYGYGHARFFNPNFASLSDVMFLNNLTKKLYLYGEPILWTKEGVQLTADTLIVTFRETMDSITQNKKLQPDSLFAFYNSFLIEQKPEYFGYNQAKGQRINGVFKQGKLDYLQLLDSCKTLYYYKDDEDLIINFSKTDTIDAFFEQGAIQNIFQKGNNIGTLSPVQNIGKEEKTLEGFNPFFALKAFNRNNIRQANKKPRIIDTLLLMETNPDSLQIASPPIKQY